MKSYIQGMITGGVLVFATLVFMGVGEYGSSGWDIAMNDDDSYLYSRYDGKVYLLGGHNKYHMREQEWNGKDWVEIKEKK